MASPFTRRVAMRVIATAITVDYEFMLCEAPVAGTYSVAYTPDTVLTGADTDNRQLDVYNRLSDASGTTKSHTLTFANGTNAAAKVKKTIPVVTAGTTNVCAVGDVIALNSLHNGNGLAQPAGIITVDFVATS